MLRPCFRTRSLTAQHGHALVSFLGIKYVILVNPDRENQFCAPLENILLIQSTE